LEIGSFYHSPRVKQLSFTIFKSIQPVSGPIDFHSRKEIYTVSKYQKIG